ncbi:MAG: hypothetical protein ABII75_00955 [Candidatus Omnitrophota bacterium]
MRREITVLSLIFILAAAADIVGVAAGEEIANIQNEIKIYNLINGLYLNESQMRFILARAQELKKKNKEFEYLYVHNLTSQKEILLDLEEEVKEDKGEIAQGTVRDVHELKSKMQKLKKRHIATLKSKAQAVKAILSENQLHIIQNYKPGLVPARTEARIGQDASSARFIELLEKIRRMPQDQYAKNKTDIAAACVRNLSVRFALLEDYKIKQAQNKLTEIMDKARANSGADFMAGKNTLLKEIKDAVTIDKDEVDAEKVIARFLLEAEVIPILKEKLRALKNPTLSDYSDFRQ